MRLPQILAAILCLCWRTLALAAYPAPKIEWSAKSSGLTDGASNPTLVNTGSDGGNISTVDATFFADGHAGAGMNATYPVLQLDNSNGTSGAFVPFSHALGTVIVVGGTFPEGSAVRAVAGARSTAGTIGAWRLLCDDGTGKPVAQICTATSNTDGKATGTAAQFDTLNSLGDPVIHAMTFNGATTVTLNGQAWTMASATPAGTPRTPVSNIAIGASYGSGAALQNNCFMDVYGFAVFAETLTNDQIHEWAQTCLTATAATGANTPAVRPDLQFDARDVTGTHGMAITSISEHNGGTSAAVKGGVLISGFNSQPAIQLSSAVAGQVIDLLASTDYKTIGLCVRSDGTILGANAAGNPTNGAFNLRVSSKNTLATVNSAGGDTTTTDTTGSSMATVPVVYTFTRTDDNKIRIRVNGFKIAETDLGGAATALTSLTIFSRYTSGSASNPAAGELYAVQCFTPAQTESNCALIERDLAWPFGPPQTKRWRIVSFDNNTNALAAAESDNGTAWVSQRKVSHLSLTGSIRDPAFEGYDAATDAYYFSGTENNFSNFGGTFGRFKTRGDFRLWQPAASVDATVGGFINGTTNSPWGPRAVLDTDGFTGTPTQYTFTKSNSTSVYIATISGWPAAPTIGTPTILGGGGMDQVKIRRTGWKGNPVSNSFRIYGGQGFQDASAIAGTYGTRTDFVSTSGFSHEYADLMAFDNGQIAVVCVGTDGYTYYLSSDNGATFGGKNSMSGLGISQGGTIDMAQSDILDAKKIGLWSPLTNPPAGNGVNVGSASGLHVGGRISF